MATTKPTRSPRRAQLPAPPVSPLNRPRQRSTPSRRGLPLQPYAEKGIVYETLHALNRDFEQVLAGLATLDKLRLFRPDLSNIFWIRTQELRTHVTYEVLEVMHQVEPEDWAIYGRMHRQWEKKYDNRDDDILLQAKEIKEQRRKEAQKKANRKKGA